MLVGKIMTPNPITASPDTSHREALELMRTHDISHLPVVDRGRLVGIVADDDLLSTQPSPATTLSIYEIHSLLEKLKLGQFMAHPVITVAEDCLVEAAARAMLDYDIGCLPVMCGEELVGIVTDTDIFRTLAEVLGGGKDGLRFSVRVADQPGRLAQCANAVAESGGNILSVVVWQDDEIAGTGILTIKESGADAEKLRAALKAVGADLVDMHADSVCEVQLFGKGK